MSAKSLPYVIKDKYIQVTVNKKPFSLDNTNPLFVRLKRALQKKNWAAVPKLISLSETLLDQATNEVSIKKGVVYYKDKQVKDALSARIIEMLTMKKDVKHMLLFMDNLYQNPSKLAIEHFYSWLENNDLPITDDGEFLAYKSVNDNFRDTHTGTVDNTPGRTNMMDRNRTDENYYQQCGKAFHVCSKQYGVYGTRILAVKVNPRDVVAANDGKMQVVKYEVLMELGSKNDSLFQKEGFSKLEKKLVVEVKKEKAQMYSLIINHPEIKRKLRKKKVSRLTLRKYSYAKMKILVQKLGLAPKDKEALNVGPADPFYLFKARKTAKITRETIAKKMQKTVKQVERIEKNKTVDQSDRDSYLAAISAVTGNKVVSFPATA